MTDAPFPKTHRETQDVLMRIREYIGHGGLFNPDLMDHDKVRDLVVDCRDAIAAALAEIDQLTAENDRLTHSLRDVRERKDQRINELIQQITATLEAR
jgi:hypothetical protein